VWFGGKDDDFVSYITGRGKSEIESTTVWLKLEEKSTSVKIDGNSIQVWQNMQSMLIESQKFLREDSYTVSFDLHEDHIKVPKALYSLLFNQLNKKPNHLCRQSEQKTICQCSQSKNTYPSF